MFPKCERGSGYATAANWNSALLQYHLAYMNWVLLLSTLSGRGCCVAWTSSHNTGFKFEGAMDFKSHPKILSCTLARMRLPWQNDLFYVPRDFGFWSLPGEPFWVFLFFRSSAKWVRETNLLLSGRFKVKVGGKLDLQLSWQSHASANTWVLGCLALALAQVFLFARLLAFFP